MNRGTFIKNLITLVGTTQLPSSIFEQYKKVYLLHFFVRGFQYYEGPKIINLINKNGLVKLVREPNNKYDSYAIAIYFENKKIGFIPQEDNLVLANIMDADLLDLQAEITHIEPKAETWEQIAVAIYALKKMKFGENNIPKHLTEYEPLHYYTIKDGEDGYKRIFYEEKELLTGNMFYSLLLVNRTNGDMHEIINQSFKNTDEFEDIVNNRRLVINKHKISSITKDIEKVTSKFNKTSEFISGNNIIEKSINELYETINGNILEIENLFSKDGYVFANIEKLAYTPDLIEKFVKITDNTGNIFYEVVLKL